MRLLDEHRRQTGRVSSHFTRRTLVLLRELYDFRNQDSGALTCMLYNRVEFDGDSAAGAMLKLRRRS